MRNRADFVTGFNKINENCDFTDAGNAKEGADRKLQATLDRDLYNVHCRRIILGASTNSTYASYLKRFYDIDVPSRVWLLKGPTFAFEIATILHKYKQIAFPDIIRGEKLPSAPSSPIGGHSVPAVENKRKAEVSPDDPRRNRRPENTADALADPATRPAVSYADMARTAAINAPQTGTAGLLMGPTNTVEDTSTDVEVFEPAVLSSVATFPLLQQSVPYTDDEVQVTRRLIQATLELLAQDPLKCHSAPVKHCAARKLGATHWFWRVRKGDGEWYERSNNIIKWTLETFVERTNIRCDAPWLANRFPLGTPQLRC